jgi:ribosomal protein S10
MKTDKSRFDAVLSQMVKTAPKKTAEIKAPKKSPKPTQK